MYRKGDKCLVTGCAGNVGSNLVSTLLAKGLKVIGVDNLFSGMIENMDQFYDHPDFDFVRASIADEIAIERVFLEKGPFVSVVHLAAIVSVPYSVAYPEETLAINHTSSLYLHDLSRKTESKAFVFAGSAAEYGHVLNRAVSEDDAGDPLSPYGVSKYNASKGIEASGFGCSMRFFNIYGPTRSKPGPYDGVVRLFMDCARRGKPLTILGDGMQVRDFLYINDAVRSIHQGLGLASGRPLVGIYNVGTGVATTIRQLAESVLKSIGAQCRIVYGEEREGDIRYSLANASKLKKFCGWSPETMLTDGLGRTIKKLKFAVDEMAYNN